MFKQHDKKELKTIITILQDELKDLLRYSVYNGDIFNEEIYQIKELLKKIK